MKQLYQNSPHTFQSEDMKTFIDPLGIIQFGQSKIQLEKACVVVGDFKYDLIRDVTHIGGGVWMSSIAMTMYVDEHKALFQGIKVLELGAGLGIPSMHIYNVGKPSKLVISDTDSQMTGESLRLNKMDVPVVNIDWEDSLQNQPAENKFDIIIASDCIYRNTWKPFLSTAMSHLNKGGTLIIYNGIRGDDMDEFYYALEESFDIEENESQNLIFNDEYIVNLSFIKAKLSI
jgi:protein-L-isoaspartate O-methyltransferase